MISMTRELNRRMLARPDADWLIGGAANLDTAVQILKEEISTAEALGQIYPMFEWLIVNIPAFVSIGDAALNTGPVNDTHP